MVDEEANLVAEVNKMAQGTLLLILEEPERKLIKKIFAQRYKNSKGNSFQKK